jgi:hypothetical protein
MSDQDAFRDKAAIMKHVGRLVLTPVVKDGRQLCRLSENASVPDAKDGMLLVARDGTEPPPAFSGPRSAIPISLKTNNQAQLLDSKSGR